MWRRHIIDGAKPWRSVFVMSADLDDDGLEDIITGGWWYKNPGSVDGDWGQRAFGGKANNAALVADFDGDGKLDILASEWNSPRTWGILEKVLRKLRIRSYDDRGGLVWARNTGQGEFTVMTNIPPGSGDFLQGVESISGSANRKIFLAWHRPDLELQVLSVPEKPIRDTWKLDNLFNIKHDEALSSADLDDDGDLDLVLGDRWLRNDGNDKWTVFTLHESTDSPDRSLVADINRDGKKDVIVGYEAISSLGKLAWYEPNDDITHIWRENVIATVTGPMSLGISDIDSDNDLDVVVGEHNIDHPELARLLWFENLNGNALAWKQHLIHVGDEHHDGAHVVDIDNDGDMDIISVGWEHDQLLLYENLMHNLDLIGPVH